MLIQDREENLSRYQQRENANEHYVRRQMDHIRELQSIAEKMEDDALSPVFRRINNTILAALRTEELDGIYIDLVWGEHLHRKAYLEKYLPDLKLLIK